MKLLSLFMLFISFFVFGQQDEKSNYEAIYRVSYYTDTLQKSTSIKDDISLLIGKNSSLFRSRTKILRDSLMNAEVDNIVKNGPSSEVILGKNQPYPTVGFSAEVFTENNKIRIYKKLFKYQYNFALENNIRWEIGKESKIIEGYKCRIAFGKYLNRNYIAWFTEEIPISEGPYVFKGLPGLIVEVSDSEGYYHFGLIGFKKNSKPIQKIAGSITTTYTEYKKVKQNYFDNPVGMMESQMGKSLPESVRQSLMSRNKKDRNTLD